MIHLRVLRARKKQCSAFKLYT